ncbi:SEC15 (YGL233W) [Zygosaccharomyces parabailii]|nr:SEC15 (YGL233W) [Zygosaccharomyces parabailii]
MEQEAQAQVSQEFQKVLLSSVSTALPSLLDDEKLADNSTKTEIGHEDVLGLDTQAFDRWVPYLRSGVEKDQLGLITEELYNSVDDHFEGLEAQLLQDSQVSDKLRNSIGQISRVHNLIENSLVKDINHIQEQLNYSTNEVIMKKEVYVNDKKTSLKIFEANILITKVLQILELSNKCQELIIERDFFKALQNLDNLERIYLQEFKNYKFQFLKEIYNSIPYLKSSIKNECINSIRNSFNSNIGKNIGGVGEAYFNVYDEELFPTWLEKKDMMKLGNFKFNSPVEISLRDEELVEKLDLRNFFHLDEFHDSIPIFRSLNELDYLTTEFKKEYEFRKAKIIDPLTWKKSQNSGGGTAFGDYANDSFAQSLNMGFLKQYLLKILGFLLYDIHLNRSTDFMLVNNNYNATNEVWDALIVRLEPYLDHFVKSLTMEEELNEFKNFMCIYVCILENQKLNIEALYKLLIWVFEKVCTINKDAFKAEFDILLHDDDFMPLAISDRALYEKMLKICWMKDDELAKSKANAVDNSDQFTITLPFSPLYPMTCTLLKKTYNKLIHFIGTYYRHELHTLNSILVRTMESIFSNVINEKIRAKLDSTSREEIAQILINLDYFIIAAKEFSNLMTKDNILQNPSIEIKLSSISSYVESRKYAEDQLIDLIDSKVTDILETVDLDWNAKELRQDPDISIVDVAQFLEMMFSSTLVNLPYSVQTLLIFREFDSLTRQFLDILLHSTPPRISQESVQNFEVDMKYLESIISRIFPTQGAELNANNNVQSPVPGTSPSVNGYGRSSNTIENNIKSLEATFTELKQCIELLKIENVGEYNDSEVRLRKYPRIKPEDAVLLMSKIDMPLSPEMQPSLEDINLTNSQDSNYRELSSNGRKIANFFNRN